MFAQDNRVCVRQPEKNLQLKMMRALSNGSEFLAYIDAMGTIDGQRCLIDGKTTTSRYAEEPDGLLSLDPQLVCYSWISGIPDVALVVFVRKRLPEVPYLKASITDTQRGEFDRLVSATASQIEASQFPPHSGIRFPTNGCTSCPHLGLCLGSQSLVDSKLIRRPGAADLIGLTNFRSIGNGFVEPKLNRRRAVFVLAKIDEILAWEQRSERERDTHFVELGRYLCEVQAGQYWRIDNLKSFGEFLERKFPESRRKAYYLMAIHEQLPRQMHRSLERMGWTKARELVKVVRREGQGFDCAPWVHKAHTMPREEFKRAVEQHLTGKETEA